MGTKKQFWCDLCETKDGDATLYGLVFKDGRNFDIGGKHETDGKHICRNCLTILVMAGSKVLENRAV